MSNSGCCCCTRIICCLLAVMKRPLLSTTIILPEAVLIQKSGVYLALREGTTQLITRVSYSYSTPLERRSAARVSSNPDRQPCFIAFALTELPSLRLEICVISNGSSCAVEGVGHEAIFLVEQAYSISTTTHSSQLDYLNGAGPQRYTYCLR